MFCAAAAAESKAFPETSRALLATPASMFVTLTVELSAIIALSEAALRLSARLEVVVDELVFADELELEPPLKWRPLSRPLISQSEFMQS